jgi:hypothetical protein
VAQSPKIGTLVQQLLLSHTVSCPTLGMPLLLMFVRQRLLCLCAREFFSSLLSAHSSLRTPCAIVCASTMPSVTTTKFSSTSSCEQNSENTFHRVFFLCVAGKMSGVLCSKVATLLLAAIILVVAWHCVCRLPFSRVRSTLTPNFTLELGNCIL